jgi:hypothetical protein
LAVRKVSHQKERRDAEAVGGPRQDYELDGAPDELYSIEAIAPGEAAEFIRRYEYLGTPGHPLARYGARAR